MSNPFKTYSRYLIALALSLTLMGCADTIDAILGNNAEIEKGEKVQFTTVVPDVPLSSRAYADWKKEVDAYKPVNREYTFNIEMWKKGDETATASALYKPSIVSAEGLEASTPLDNDGTLVSVSEESEESEVARLYWQDNVNEWGFKATTVSSNNIETDQSNQTKWLHQDLLEGYSYLPIWEGSDDDGHGKDSFNEINYRTSKQWYSDNQTAQQLSGLMIEGMGNEAFKKIPLYMKHKRAWLTVILKAGEGVTRDAVAYANSKEIETTLYSYSGSTQTDITKPWRNEAKVDYSNDKNGAAQENASTTRYDAIVEPHDYRLKPEDDIIARINVANQKFTFAAANDMQYTNYTSQVQSAIEHMNAYNLEAGKHLTITATLTRASRMVLITAWVEDWTETVTTTLCDDYGQKGEPIIINSKQDLLDFLNGDRNKAGYVGIIAANTLDLDLDGDWNYNTSTTGGAGVLNATLNVAGATLKTKNQLFKSISTSGSIINGIIEVKDGASPRTVMAETNNGTIERISIKTARNAEAKATIAGLVVKNYGTIYQCSSDLRVYGAAGTEYVGGIAAESGYVNAQDKTIMPVIDDCTVDARVDGADGVKGGGIVGKADGRISNCTFEYGITLKQLQATTGSDYNFKNIFNTAATETRAYNNSWPTTLPNKVPGESSDAAQLNENKYIDKYDQVIDCEEELGLLLGNTYNIEGRQYRLSNDFTVSSDTWTHGKNSDDLNTTGEGNVFFTLDGNDKTITLSGNKTIKRTDGTNLDNGNVTYHATAPMLFSNIIGKIYDLNIYLAENIISEPSVQQNNQNNLVYNAEDAIAPLGYSAFGSKALIRNVRVTAANGKGVESATPGGLVVWAYNQANIENCIVNIPVKMWLPKNMGTQSRHYAGGIAACAGEATVTQCQYQMETGTLTGASESANQSNCFYGGIVGATSTKGEYWTPCLTVTDNSSWYNATSENQGAIVGFAAYVAQNDANNKLTNGMSSGNEGNWWSAGSNGTGGRASTTTEVMAIGKRNSVNPTKR